MLAAAGKAARVNGDAWSDLLPALARHLLGDPPAIEADGSWRYGKRGSLAVHVDGPQRGTFRDFEAGKSGGVLDLVLHLVEHVNDRTAAAAWLRAEGLLAPHAQTPVERRTPVHPSGPGPERERQRDDADARALAYARSIWSATVQAGEVDAVRRYLARRWCWPPEIALPDCVHWLSVPAARIASRRLPAGADGALVFRFDVDAQALAAVQLEALASDGQRLTAWPSSSSTREAKRLTHGRLRGAYLQLLAVWHGPEAFVFRLGRPFRVFRDALKGWNHFLKCSGTKTLDRSNNLPTVVGPEPSVWNHGFSMRASSGLLYSIARWLRRGSGCGNIEIAHRYERRGRTRPRADRVHSYIRHSCRVQMRAVRPL